MNLNTLSAFRHEVADCFLRARDALFNTVDALLTETQAKSLPELTQSPWFERKWPSVYEAFEDGRIDSSRLQQVFAQYLPAPKESPWLWVGVDSSGIARPCSLTAPDRTAQPVHNLPRRHKAISFGWQFSTVVVLPERPSSWTFILSQQRVRSQTTAIEVAFSQLERLVPLLPPQTIITLDRGYDSTWLWCRCSTLGVGVLGRIKSNRRLYRAAPAATGKRGAPRKDGDCLQPNHPATQSHPDATYEVVDLKGRPVTISCWKQMPVKEARWLELTVLRVVRPHASNEERDPRVSWFIWLGDSQADLAQIALGSARRFGQEHGYRFDKQALLWEKPRLRTPEQFERWSQVVAIAHNHLVLARDVVEPVLRPWENQHRTATPQQVRRGINTLLAQLGTPAHPPQPRGKSKGRVKGVKMGKAERFSVLRKTPKPPRLLPS